MEPYDPAGGVNALGASGLHARLKPRAYLHADPTQQPITVAPRYSPMKALQGNNPFSPAIVSSDDLARLIVKIHEAQHNAGDNHDAYLLLLYPDRALEWPQQAVPVASGSRFVLFNVGGPS